MYIQELSAHFKNNKKVDRSSELPHRNISIKLMFDVSIFRYQFSSTILYPPPTLNFNKYVLIKTSLHCRENIANSEKIFEGKFTIVLRFIGEQDIRMGAE